MPYNYEIVKEIIDDDRERIWKLEKDTQKMLKHYIENKSEVRKAFRQNYMYGFSGVMVPVAVWMENVIILGLALLTFYMMLSTIVNREKYITNMGKYFYFPVPAMLGGVSAYTLGEFIKQII